MEGLISINPWRDFAFFTQLPDKTTGVPSSEVTVSLGYYDGANRYLFDFSDDTFKTSGWVDRYLNLFEFSATYAPGLYGAEFSFGSSVNWPSQLDGPTILFAVYDINVSSTGYSDSYIEQYVLDSSNLDQHEGPYGPGVYVWNLVDGDSGPLLSVGVTGTQTNPVTGTQFIVDLMAERLDTRNVYGFGKKNSTTDAHFEDSDHTGAYGRQQVYYELKKLTVGSTAEGSQVYDKCQVGNGSQIEGDFLGDP